MRLARWLIVASGVLLSALTIGHSGAPTETTVAARARTTTTTVPVVTTTTTVPPPTTTRPPRASRAPVRPRPIRSSVDEATKARVIAAIYSYTDWDAARMVRIASCESGLNPWAVNGKHHGILQIANATLGLIEEHIALGHRIWLRQGYGAWQCKG